MRTRVRALGALIALGVVGFVLLGRAVPAYAPLQAHTEGQPPAPSSTPRPSATLGAEVVASPSASGGADELAGAPSSTPTPPPTVAPTLRPTATVTPSPPVATPVPTPAPSSLLALLEADPALRDEICRPDREIVPGEGEVVVPMLLYHFVGRDNLEADGLSTTRYNVTVADFETQLALLHHLGYQTVTVREVVAALLDGEPLPERPIAVTVDDGWMEQYTHLFPILQAYGMRGTFYVPSTYPVGGRFVTWEHLAEMVEAGMEIGSHTRKHVGLTGLDDATLWYELQGSKATLEEHLGVTVDTLSYPFGNYTGRVMRVAAEVGYRGAVAMGSSPRQSVPSLYALHRVEVFGDRPLIDFVSRLPWRGLGTPLCGDEAGRFNGRYD